jgi:peptidoglycan/LPS O-acetylase OafA/YrhL
MWRLVDQLTGLGETISVGVIAGALTLIIAWLSYRYIELMFIRVGRKQWSTGPSKPAAQMSLS